MFDLIILIQELLKITTMYNEHSKNNNLRAKQKSSSYNNYHRTEKMKSIYQSKAGWIQDLKQSIWYFV